MSAFRNVAQSFKNLWGQGGDDEEYEDVAEETEEEYEDAPTSHREPTTTHRESASRRQSITSNDRISNSLSDDDFGAASTSERYQRFTSPTMPTSASRASLDSISGGASSASSGSRKLRPVAMPLRSREKNIYTLKPKSMDEAGLAADYLKTGCAVVVNLDEVEKMVAIRIIDFMSGVCYGLENQGHAMKLGDTIFLFTPGDFEISSDETDYGENRDFIFKDETHPSTKAAVAKEPVPAQVQAIAEQRRSWER